MTTPTISKADDSVISVLQHISNTCFKTVEENPSNASSTLSGEVPLLSTVIYPSYALVNAGGITKNVSIESLIGILGAERPIEEPSASVTLPPNVFNMALTSNTIELNCYYPGGIREIKYKPSSKIQTFSIPFPNLVLYFRLAKLSGKQVGGVKWQVEVVSYFATDKSLLQMPTEIVSARSSTNGLYLVPFTNFYNNGGLCYGGNTMPMRHSDNLRGLDYFYQVIFTSPFNDDLGVKMKIGGVHRSPGDFYRELSKLTEFPYSDMISDSGTYY